MIDPNVSILPEVTKHYKKLTIRSPILGGKINMQLVVYCYSGTNLPDLLRATQLFL